MDEVERVFIGAQADCCSLQRIIVVSPSTP